MVQITNHVQRAISLLAAQFQETKRDDSATNFQKLITALVGEAQGIEDVNWQLYTERWLNSAEGVQLDGIGQILGLPRNPGESDADYRERLRFQAFINASNGTPEEIIKVLYTLTNATYVWYHELYPAAFQLYTDGLTFPDPPCEVVEAIHQVSPAGVQYAPITASMGVPIPFIFGNDPVPSLLVVTDTINPAVLDNLQVTDGVFNYLLQVNANRIPFTAEVGYLAEAFPDYSVFTDGAGQLAEVFYLNSNLPPA
jgi:hypothetical protein